MKYFANEGDGGVPAIEGVGVCAPDGNSAWALYPRVKGKPNTARMQENDLRHAPQLDT